MRRAPISRGPHRLHRASLTLREALLFEAGIKLGGVFHQYLGTPVAPSSAATLARTIAEAVQLQPYVKSVRVTIDPSRGGPQGRGQFGYRYLTPEMLRVEVTLAEAGVEVRARLAHRRDLRYPLMSVQAVKERRARGRTTSARRAGRT